MAKCLKHNQEYDTTKGEYCVYCGDPNKTMIETKEVKPMIKLPTIKVKRKLPRYLKG